MVSIIDKSLANIFKIIDVIVHTGEKQGLSCQLRFSVFQDDRNCLHAFIRELAHSQLVRYTLLSIFKNIKTFIGRIGLILFYRGKTRDLILFFPLYSLLFLSLYPLHFFA